MRDVYIQYHYGCDDRFKKISRSIRVTAPYVKRIRILNLGPDKNTEKFAPLQREFPNLQVVNVGRHYFATVSEDWMRYSIMDVPEGAWAGWFDSDWRLSPYFLEHMQEAIDTCETEGKNALYSYQLGHYVDYHADDPTLPRWNYYFQPELDKWIAAFRKDPNMYGYPLLYKVGDKTKFWTDGFFGNHSYIVPVPYLRKEFPEMYHLHLRDFTEQAYCSTMSFQSWWFIGHNEFNVQKMEDIYNSWEYDALEAFKIKHRCWTSNEFSVMKQDPAFREKLRELWKQFGESKIFGCQQMYKMATKYDMEFLGADTEDIPCDGVCCQYKCGKIKDLPI